MLDLTPFADPWEHFRLLSDAPRNEAILDLLKAHAPGARVAEIGCGTGLWSVIAASLGAIEVWAIEPTAVAEVARALIEANQLTDRVFLLEDCVEDLDPRPVDLLFSELLNADPFAEGVVEAMAAGQAWLAPGAIMAPHRLDVFAALIREGDSAAEANAVRTQLATWSKTLDLKLDPIQDLLTEPEPYSYIGTASTLAGAPSRLWSLELGSDETPERSIDIQLPVAGDEPVHGVAVWFEAHLGSAGLLHNRPSRPGHWGNWIAGFADPLRVTKGAVALCFNVADGSLEVCRA